MIAFASRAHSGLPEAAYLCLPTMCTHQFALDAARRELLLVAAGAVDLLLARDERLGADGRLADAAREALLVPLARLVLHLLGACVCELNGHQKWIIMQH